MRLKVVCSFLLLGVFAFGLSACEQGQTQPVVDAKLKSYQKDGDVFAEVSVVLNTGSVQLPVVESSRYPSGN